MQRLAEKSGYNAPSWAAKFALLVAGILSGGVAARTAVPVAAGAISSAVPRFWAAFRPWFSPPYLFFAVHVIIFVIWRLSETKQSPRSPPPSSPEVVAAKAKSVRSCQGEPLLKKPSQEFWKGIHQTLEPAAEVGASPPSDASCVTTKSEESSISPVSSGFEFKKSFEPVLGTCVVKIPKEAASEASAEEEEGVKEEEEEDEGENASMEATWKAIMEKSSRPAVSAEAPVGESPKPVAVTGVREPPMMIHDEMNQKFDDFIKKHHNQMRLQRHESDRRRAAEMAKRSPNSN